MALSSYVVGASIIGLFSISSSSPALAGAGGCYWETMPDGSRVEMCTDANGKWFASGQKEGATPREASTGLPDRAEVTYRGNWSATETVTPKMNLNNLSLGSLLGQALNTQQRNLGGDFNIKVSVTGSTLTASIWGADYSKEQYTGTIQNGICRLAGMHSGGQDRFEGRCGREGFAGSMIGKSARGNKIKATFDTSAVQIVDLDQRDREQLAARKAQEAQIAAAEAKLRNAPSAGPILSKKLDGYVRADSRGWAFNHYDAGSMSNVKIIEGSVKSGHYVMRGEYSYNGGASGWVLAKMAGPSLECIQFHDAMVGCRALRTAAQGQAMRSAAIGVFSGGGSNRSSYDASNDPQQDIDRNNRERAQEEANRPPPPPPVEPIGGNSGLYGSDHSCC